MTVVERMRSLVGGRRASDAAPSTKGRLAAQVRTELLTASRFAVVGGVATLVHLTVVWILTTRFAIEVYRANLTAFLGAFAFSFLGHHFWTFRGSADVGRRLFRFALISGIAFLANSVLLTLLLHTGLFAPPVAAIVAAISIPALTFVSSRVWGFRGR